MDLRETVCTLSPGIRGDHIARVSPPETCLGIVARQGKPLALRGAIRE